MLYIKDVVFSDIYSFVDTFFILNHLGANMFEGRLIRQKDSIIQLIISDYTVVVGETHTRQEFKF